MANRLTKKVGLYFIGNLSSRFLGAALIPIYAFAVSPSALGRYDYVLTIGQLAAPLAFVAIWEAALRFLITESPTAARSTVSTIVGFALVVSAIAGVAGTIVGWALSLDPLDLAGFILIALLYGLVQVWQYVARAEQETRLYVTSGITSAVLTFALVVVLVVVLRLEFLGLLIAYIAGQVSILLLIEIRMGVLRRVNWRTFDWRLLGRMLKYCCPLVVNLMAIGFLGGFGRILIYHELGDAENGIYSFAMKFATIVVSLGTVVSMSVIEEGLLRSASSKVGEFYSKVLNALILILFLFITALVPALYLFFGLIRGTAYFGARDLVPVLLLFAVLSVLGTHFGSVFMTVGRTGALGSSTLVGAAVTVIASLTLIRPSGLIGVAFALVLGSLVTMILRAVLSRKKMEYDIAGLQAAAVLAAYVSVSIGCWVAADHAPTWVTAVLTGAVPLICAWPFMKSLRAIKEIPDEIEV